jgi:HNH endonuclease
MAEARYINSDGYRVIEIDETEYFAHDLAWLWMTGEFPKGQIEHINGIKDDNRWCNLRIK